MYDEKITQPRQEGAARMKNVVQDYSNKGEAALVIGRSDDGGKSTHL